MGKIRRGLLWGLFPPAGAAASMSAGRRKQTAAIVEAIEGIQPASAPAPAELLVAPARTPEQQVRWGGVVEHRKEIEQRLRAGGVKVRSQRMVATMQVMRLVSDDGLTIDDAIARVLGWRSAVG